MSFTLINRSFLLTFFQKSKWAKEFLSVEGMSFILINRSFLLTFFQKSKWAKELLSVELMVFFYFFYPGNTNEMAGCLNKDK